MEIASTASKRSRIDLRLRHRVQDVTPQKPPVQEEKAKEVELLADLDAPLPTREQKSSAVMGRAHGLFHRRAAAESSKVLTVIVNVVATVDSNGSTLLLATSTPGLVNVQAVPSVPAVPPFPTDLTVPAYPWPSGVPSAQISTSASSSLLSTLEAGSAISSTFPSPLGFNSTTSSALPSSSSFSSQNSTSYTSLTSSTSASSTQSQFSTTSPLPTTSTSLVGGGGGNPANTAPAAATSTAAGSGKPSNNSTPLTTPKVVASVIGSLAGAALFLAIILFLLRRYKQKHGGVTRQITADDAADSQPMASSGQQMATRRSYVPASTAAFLNRFSGASRSTADTSTTGGGGGERGFQRISGRKLPSAFSEGMTSDQFTREGKLSGSSFYQDDKGFYGGPGIPPAGEPSAVATAGAKERIITMPSPARTPTIHHAPPPFGTSRNGGSMLSPPHSPNPSLTPRNTLGRSHPSQDGSRNSKFTEDV